MLFSVVVPVYNKRPHLRRAIRSVLAQTLVDFELIVIDDASTDASLDEIKDLDDSRIRRLRRDEPGPGGYAARNLGISEARADWVAFLDADDEWSPDFLASISALRERYPEARFACTAYWDVSSEGASLPNAFARAAGKTGPRLIGLLEYAKASSRGLLPVRTSAAALDRQLLIDIGGFPAGKSRRGGDNDTWFRAMRKTCLAWSPRKCATYYRNAVNMTTNVSRPDFNLCIDANIRTAIGETPRSWAGMRLRFWLKRLANREKKGALKDKIRSGTLSRADLRGLYRVVEPAYVSWMLAWALLPKGATRAIVDAYKRAKAGILVVVGKA
jgi:succinoglycan biosynthesis protein ExoO